MTEADIVAAHLLDNASAEIAGAIAELIAAARDRGENVDLSLLTEEIVGALLGSAWKLSVFNAAGDRLAAAEWYGGMLDRHREAVRAVSDPDVHL